MHVPSDQCNMAYLANLIFKYDHGESTFHWPHVQAKNCFFVSLDLDHLRGAVTYDGHEVVIYRAHEVIYAE